MDIKKQIIREYLTQGGGFRKLALKYGISRTTICKWVLIPPPSSLLSPTNSRSCIFVYKRILKLYLRDSGLLITNKNYQIYYAIQTLAVILVRRFMQHLFFVVFIFLASCSSKNNSNKIISSNNSATDTSIQTTLITLI